MIEQQKIPFITKNLTDVYKSKLIELVETACIAHGNMIRMSTPDLMTFCVTYTLDQTLCVSMSKGSEEYPDASTVLFLQDYYGSPSELFVKESSLDPGMNIIYMRWHEFVPDVRAIH